MTKQISAQERRRIAEKVGLNEQYLYQCLTGRREMDAAEAVRVAAHSDGLLTVADLCTKTHHLIWPANQAAA